jgi:hypothetical protein
LDQCESRTDLSIDVKVASLPLYLLMICGERRASSGEQVGNPGAEAETRTQTRQDQAGGCTNASETQVDQRPGCKQRRHHAAGCRSWWFARTRSSLSDGVLGLVGLGAAPDAKDIEIAVLRHQLMVLRRQSPDRGTRRRTAGVSHVGASAAS